MKPNLKSQERPSRTKPMTDVDALREFVETHKCAVDYLICLLKDIKNNLPPKLYSSAELNLDLSTIQRRFASEGLSFATTTLPKLSAGLFQYLETGLVDYPSFKLTKDAVHPVFLQGLFRLACSDGAYQTQAISDIYQISVLFKKLKGPYLNSVLVKQLDDFVATDKELGLIDVTDEVRLPIMQQARAEIYRLFKGFNLDYKKVKPRPGPGATNKPVAKHLRYRPHVLYTQIEKVFPYVDWFMVNPYDLVHQTKLFQALYKSPVAEQRARLKYVFKIFGKARGICMEENETQFFQQSVKNGMYDWIENSPITKGRIAFSDQSINAFLALKSSADREKATIDLTEASNRVIRDVVSWLFQDTEIHDALMALSTKWIDLPKELKYGLKAIKCNMYAPMGSGLCFPIETVVHWALIRALIALSQYPDDYKEDVYVYGDDIIIPSEITEMIYTYLPLFGMKINRSKSYYRSHFRESCGIHAYNGIDITPIFIKNLPVSSSLTVIMSCLAAESDLNKKGYSSLALHYEKEIRQAMTGYQMPFVPRGSSVLGFIRDNIVLPTYPGKVHKKLDRYGNVLWRVRVVSPKIKRDLPPTEFESYLRHVLTLDNDKKVSGNPLDFELKWKWAPSPELHQVNHPPKWLKLLRDNRDQRSMRDITKEALYEQSNQDSEANRKRVYQAKLSAVDQTTLHLRKPFNGLEGRCEVRGYRLAYDFARFRCSNRVSRHALRRRCAA